MKLFGHLDRMMDHFMIIEDVAGEKKVKHIELMLCEFCRWYYFSITSTY